MKIKEKIGKYQMGGAMEAPAAQPQAGGQQAPQQSQNPLEPIIQLAMEGLQSQNCETMRAACEALIQLVDQMGSAEQAPSEPVFKKGGKMVKKITKMTKSCKK